MSTDSVTAALAALYIAVCGTAVVVLPTTKPETQAEQKPPVEVALEQKQAEQNNERLESIEQQLQKIEEQAKRIDAKIDERGLVRRE